MKKLSAILAALAILFSVSTASAQKTKTKKKTQTTTTTTETGIPDGVRMENGKMMLVKSGKAKPLDRDLVLEDGTKVMMNGTVVRPDGQTTMMSNGDVVTMTGKLRLGGIEEDQPVYMSTESLKPETVPPVKQDPADPKSPPVDPLAPPVNEITTSETVAPPAAVPQDRRSTTTAAPAPGQMTYEDMEKRMNLMNEKMRLMNEKMKLLTDKMNMMQGSAGNKANTTQMDEEIKRLEEQMRNLDSQMKK